MVPLLNFLLCVICAFIATVDSAEPKCLDQSKYPVNYYNRGLWLLSPRDLDDGRRAAGSIKITGKLSGCPTYAQFAIQLRTGPYENDTIGLSFEVIQKGGPSANKTEILVSSYTADRKWKQENNNELQKGFNIGDEVTVEINVDDGAYDIRFNGAKYNFLPDKSSALSPDAQKWLGVKFDITDVVVHTRTLYKDDYPA